MIVRHMPSAVASGLFLFLASSSIESQDEAYPPTPEGIRRYLDVEYPEAPEDLVTRYIEEVKKSTMYGTLRTAEVEAVRSLVKEQLEPLGVEFYMDDRRSLDAFPDVIQGTGAGLYRQDVELPDGDEVELQILHDPEKDKSYRVAPRRLSEIDFRYVQSVGIEDPYFATLDRFTATHSTLAEVVKELAELGDVDLVLKYEGDQRVTIDVRNRSVAECLMLATSVAGYELVVEPQPRVTHLNVLEVLKEGGRPESLRQLLGEGEAPDSPLEGLGEALLEAARSVKYHRPVVLVKPPGNEEK